MSLLFLSSLSSLAFNVEPSITMGPDEYEVRQIDPDGDLVLYTPGQQIQAHEKDAAFLVSKAHDAGLPVVQGLFIGSLVSGPGIGGRRKDQNCYQGLQTERFTRFIDDHPWICTQSPPPNFIPDAV
ncbi:unnamed protein product [Penicillium bialowiezense]